MQKVTDLKYVDFVDLKYTPKATDVICTFHVEPAGTNMKETAGGVAAESSIGTWTELTTVKPYLEKLAAHVFNIEGEEAKIAYPIELFEQGNMPNILSSVAGNVFGLRALKNLRLVQERCRGCYLVRYQSETGLGNFPKNPCIDFGDVLTYCLDCLGPE